MSFHFILLILFDGAWWRVIFSLHFWFGQSIRLQFISIRNLESERKNCEKKITKLWWFLYECLLPNLSIVILNVNVCIQAWNYSREIFLIFKFFIRVNLVGSDWIHVSYAKYRWRKIVYLLNSISSSVRNDCSRLFRNI